ncbi:hypothetical protein quinque_016506 [Culex quinquefasciatus]
MITYHAEWRASWTTNSENEQEQRILEGVPIQVSDHNHRVECLVTNGNMMFTSQEPKTGKVTRNNEVTNIKLTGNKVVAARLSGRIDFLRLETYTQGRQIDWGFTSAYRRTHIRTGSAGSLSMFQQPNGSSQRSSHSEEKLRCILEIHQQGHQMPVTCLEDHTVTSCSLRCTVTAGRARVVARSNRQCPASACASAKGYRKLREYEQEKFLNIVKQV